MARRLHLHVQLLGGLVDLLRRIVRRERLGDAGQLGDLAGIGDAMDDLELAWRIGWQGLRPCPRSRAA
jgi:hypothetical protein